MKYAKTAADFKAISIASNTGAKLGEYMETHIKNGNKFIGAMQAADLWGYPMPTARYDWRNRCMLRRAFIAGYLANLSQYVIDRL